MKLSMIEKRQAFTLMEVLCIVIIISVMSSIILPVASNFQTTELAFAEAGKLVADVRTARYRAMEHQCYTRIQFMPMENGWSVEELYDSATDEPVEGEPYLSTHNAWKSFIDEEYREARSPIIMKFDPDPPSTIYFRPDGLLVSDAKFTAAPLGIQKVTFTAEDNEEAQGAELLITPAGVIESRAYYNENF
ncbi:MAG: hypothetical protein Kow0029_26780 [Candidatus Rifleibacteriota bacterium]